MKYPDALRMLCRAIVEKHIPGEKVAFELAGEQLLDEPPSDATAEDLTRAEFGSSSSGDLEILAVARALKRTTDAWIRSKKDSSLAEVTRHWTANMQKYGIDAVLAAEIADQHGEEAHAYILEQRSLRG